MILHDRRDAFKDEHSNTIHISIFTCTAMCVVNFIHLGRPYMESKNTKLLFVVLKL